MRRPWARFSPSCESRSGAHAGTRLRLRGWQSEAIQSIYSTDASGHRAIRTAVISAGRKCGKTTFCAALALAHLCGPEARPRGQIVSAAADRGQAALIYNELRAFILADKRLSDRIEFRDYAKTATDVVTGSTFAALSADYRKAHGLSPTVAIADEIAQWRGDELFRALQTGQGAHAEPLLLAISTRSPDPENPLETLIRYGADVTAGVVEDPAFASFVYTAPLELDRFDPATWAVANPDMDAARLADIANLAQQARRLPSLIPSFDAFVLNRPVATDDRFISPEDWDGCGDTAEPLGSCFGGLDLAGGAADLTAFALYWPETGLLRTWAFMPAGQIAAKELEDRAPYSQWATAGHVVVTPGRAIDRAWLAEWLARETESLDLQAIAADRWMLADLIQQCEREGVTLPFEPHGQGFKDMSPSIGAFERTVLDASLRHGGNPLLRWAVSNAAIEPDPAGNRKLSKMRSRGRIDPLIAAVMAIGLAAKQPAMIEYDFDRPLVLSA
ncbi:MAG: terminase TerL endonuclease subunit [Rhodoplanes sp.]